MKTLEFESMTAPSLKSLIRLAVGVVLLVGQSLLAQPSAAEGQKTAKQRVKAERGDGQAQTEWSDRDLQGKGAAKDAAEARKGRWSAGGPVHEAVSGTSDIINIPCHF